MRTKRLVTRFLNSGTVLGRTADYMLLFLLAAVGLALLLDWTGNTAALGVLFGSTALSIIVAVLVHGDSE